MYISNVFVLFLQEPTCDQVTKSWIFTKLHRNCKTHVKNKEKTIYTPQLRSAFLW